MFATMSVYQENARLRLENENLKRRLANERAIRNAFTSDTELRILDHIHKIKCRDEVPNRIFLGKKEWDALKALTSAPMSGSAYLGSTPGAPCPIKARYMGYEVVKVDKATFVDVSTIP